MQNLFRCIVIAFGLLLGIESGNVYALFKKEMVDAEALTTKQKQCIDGLNNFQKSLSELQNKMKSIQATMIKAEKKHKITEDTSFWMIFRYIISTLEYECDYLIRFVKEVHENISKYEKQAKKGKGVEETIVTNIQMALENFNCLGHRVNVACFRGVFAVMLQYILQIRECPEEEQQALEPIISEKHLAILSKNKDLYALIGSVLAKIPPFFNSLVTVSQITNEDEDSEEGGSSTKLKFITDGLEMVLLSLQDAVIYVRGGTLTEKMESEIKGRFQRLTTDLVVNVQQMGVRRPEAVINNQNNVQVVPVNQSTPLVQTDNREDIRPGNNIQTPIGVSNQGANLPQTVGSESITQQNSVQTVSGEKSSAALEGTSNSQNTNSVAAAAMKAAKAAILRKSSDISESSPNEEKNNASVSVSNLQDIVVTDAEKAAALMKSSDVLKSSSPNEEENSASVSVSNLQDIVVTDAEKAAALMRSSDISESSSPNEEENEDEEEEDENDVEEGDEEEDENDEEADEDDGENEE